jgi:hypothetical protein
VANREYGVKVREKKNKNKKMKYREFEELMSPQRIGKYYSTCDGHALKTLSLYQANIRLSQGFLGVLSVFEVALRNRIDQHYRTQSISRRRSQEWLLTSIQPGGFLTNNGCQSSLDKVAQAYKRLGSSYSHDKLIAELSFGFWRHLFAGRQFKAGGGTLLAIFPNLPPRRNQTFVYQKLHRINSVRNRIAHHEPICFGGGNVISTTYARTHFQEIADILGYMSVENRHLFMGFTSVLDEANYIDSI